MREPKQAQKIGWSPQMNVRRKAVSGLLIVILFLLAFFLFFLPLYGAKQPNADNAAPGTLKWKAKLGKNIQSPVQADGIVYVVGADYGAYAFDALTGHEKWKALVPGTWASSPAFGNHKIFLTIRLASGNSRLIAFDQYTGRQVLDVQIEDWEAYDPVYSNGVVYFGGGSGNYANPYGPSYDASGHVYAVDAQTGHIIWTVPTGGKPSSVAVAVTVADGLVYCWDGLSHILALESKTGQERWRFERDFSYKISITAADGAVYFADSYRFSYGIPGHLYAVDSETGKLKWQVQDRSRWYSSLAIQDRTLYFASNAARYYCIDNCSGGPTSYEDDLEAVDVQTGQVKWKIEPLNGPFPHVIADNGLLYYDTLVGSGHNSILVA